MSDREPMSFEFPIERGTVRAFAEAGHATSLDYGQPDAVIPPTLLTTARIRWEPAEASPSRELGFDLRRLLHGEEEYIFHGPPPRVGDSLTATSSLHDQYERAGKRGGTMRFAVIRTTFADSAGRLVAEQLSTLIETAQAPTSDG